MALKSKVRDAAPESFVTVVDFPPDLHLELDR